MSTAVSSVESALGQSAECDSDREPAVTLTLPYPAALPSHRIDLAIAVRDIVGGADLARTFTDPFARTALRLRLSGGASPARPGEPAVPLGARGATSREAEEYQAEHDRYFQVRRSARGPAHRFVAGLLLAHLAAYEDCLDMGVTLLAEPEWNLLFAGLDSLLRGAGGGPPALPAPAGWRAGYDPARRWLTGHQLFFSLIQGAIVGLNCFANAMTAGQKAEANEGLRFAAAFMRSSAVAMKLASDFAPEDYERTVRPDMAPPQVRAGFSGLQTRDHTYLVRLFGALKPVFLTLGPTGTAQTELIDSVVSAYAAHEFICSRFRGDVLPSLRMEAASRGKTQRAGTAVIREMMRARLALIDPAAPGRESPS
jgi:hypothetical protein